MSVASIILHLWSQKLCNFSAAPHTASQLATKPHKMIKKIKIIAARAVPVRARIEFTDIIAIANNSIVVDYIYWKCDRIKLITIRGE